MQVSGIYGIQHLVFVTLTVLFVIAGIALVQRYGKGHRELIVRSSALFLLVWITINRVSVTADQMSRAPEVYSWLNLLPYTFCGTSSLVMSLCALFGKENSIVLHFIWYFGLFGAIATLAYPDFLAVEGFWELHCFSGLMHHAALLWVCVVTLITRWFIPDGRKWFVYPFGYGLVMLAGLFELHVLHFPEAMNLTEPLLPELPVLSSWYSIWIISSLSVLLLIRVYEAVMKNRKTNTM